MKRAAISEALRLIFEGIEHLKGAFPNRAFTIDGRLGGDVGEVIAALEYDVVLHDVSQGSANIDEVTRTVLRVAASAYYRAVHANELISP